MIQDFDYLNDSFKIGRINVIVRKHRKESNRPLKQLRGKFQTGTALLVTKNKTGFGCSVT